MSDVTEGATGVLDVEVAQAFGGFVLHMGTVTSGELRVGDTVRLAVDYGRRELLAPNHTMTHVLNFALRRVLGETVDQKGSLVAADKLRFDFSHGAALKPEELEETERIVNDVVSRALPVHTKVVPLAAGRSISSLRAVFGETYPDPVRVVSIGAPVEEVVADPSSPAWAELSVEFCGGTHLRNTSAAGRFCLVEETAVAKGIRRVVCVTKDAAVDAYNRGEELLARFSEARSLSWRELQGTTPGLKEALDASIMPAHVKANLRAELSALGIRVHHERKAEQDALVSTLVEELIEGARAQAGTGGVRLVRRLEGELGDNKVLSGVSAKLTKAFKSGQGFAPVFLWFADDSKFAAVCFVPKGGAFTAEEWLTAALGPVEAKVRSGKGGLSAQTAGKATDATGGIGERAEASHA